MWKNLLTVVAEGAVFGATFVSLCWLGDSLGWANIIP